MTLDLDLYRDLPKVRAALDAGTLQMQTDPDSETCAYTGPCAIGVMLSPEQRVALKAQDTRITMLLWDAIITAPREQWNDLMALQNAHDFCMGGNTARSRLARVQFDALFLKLEAKYAAAEVKS